MDFRQLHYFVSVARHGSFTHAAEDLHVTQPTLSKMVRQLEQELQVELLDRSRKRIRLTDAGRSILRSAESIMTSLANMKAELDDIVMLRSGELSVGLPPMIGGHFFPSVIGRFRSLYPNIRLRLIEQGGKRIAQGVIQGELDVGVVIAPVEDEELLVLEPVLEDRLAAVLPVDHRLTGRASIPLSELRADPFILFREDFTLHHLIRHACGIAGFEPNVAFESSQWDFMTKLVAERFGITLLPTRIAESVKSGLFRIVPVEQPSIPWALSLIRSRDRYVSFAAREWIRIVKEQVEDRRV